MAKLYHLSDSETQYCSVLWIHSLKLLQFVCLKFLHHHDVLIYYNHFQILVTRKKTNIKVTARKNLLYKVPLERPRSVVKWCTKSMKEKKRTSSNQIRPMTTILASTSNKQVMKIMKS